MITQKSKWRVTHFRLRLGILAFIFLSLAARTFAAITINTVEASSGAPLGDVQVALIQGTSAAAAVTGPDGKCQVAAANATNGSITFQKEGWCPLKWDLAENPPANLSNLVVKMYRAATIGGSVVDSAQKGIAGVKIYVNFPQPLWGAHIPIEDCRVTTDENGKWTAKVVPVGAEYVHLDLIQPHYRWQESQPSREELLTGRSVLTMQPLVVLEGRVLDPQGQPVAGATVYRGNSWGLMGLNNEPQATTDANGAFSFPGDTAGTVQVAAFAPAFGPVIKEVEMKVDAAPVKLVLTVPHTRRIRVTDENGRPLPGLDVRVSEWESFHYPPWGFKTDAEGRFVMTNAPADQVSMDILAPGRMGLRFHPVPPADHEQVFALGPALHLHGTVTDAKTGQPVPAFQMTPGWPRQVIVDGQLTNQGAEWAGEYQKKSFKAGAYDWNFDEPVIAGTDQPYDILLRVEAAGYAPAVSRAFKATEKDAAFDFQLAAPTVIDGVVRFSDGAPAAGAQIFLANQAWDLMAKNGQVENFRQLPMLRADEGGHFKMMREQGTPTLIVWHENGFATVDFSKFQKTNQITLTKWGRVEGILWRGNHPAPNEAVALSFEMEWTKDDQKHFRQVPQMYFNYETNTDGSGHFIFDKVPPGVTAITRVEDIKRPDQYGLRVGDVWGGCRLLVVSVPEGGALSVKAGDIGRTVTGRILSTNDLTKCLVILMRTLPPVPYPDGLTGAARDQWATNWFWSEGGAAERIWLGAPPQAEAPSGPEQGGHAWAVKLAADGTFEIPDVPAGDYTLKGIFLGSDGPMEMQMMAHGLETHLMSVSRRFTVAAGDDLPALPPQDLGDIGDADKLPSEIPVREPTAHDPITAGMMADQMEISPGDTFEVFVRVRIADGYHIYSPVPKSKVFTGTEITLNLPDGIEATSDWSVPAGVRASDGELVYTNEVVYHRSFKLASGIAAKSISLTGTLHFQACNAELCWPPNQIKFLTTLTVKPSKKGTP